MTEFTTPEAALIAEKDDAYRQRNHLVAALARLFPSGIRATEIEGWDPEWHGCVYIDLPSGQISYHYHDSEAPLFAALPPYKKLWDGHNKETVHHRLAALTTARLIAAAPDMLAALKAVEEWWLREGMHAFTGAPYAIFDTRAAIAKATSV